MSRAVREIIVASSFAFAALRCGGPADPAAEDRPASAPPVPEVYVRAALSTGPTVAPDGTRDPAGADPDDPAIWLHPSRPERSLVIASDKKTGVHVFSVAGELLQHLPQGSRTNNVDVRQHVDLGDGRPADVVAANLRSAGKLAVFIVDPDYDRSGAPPLRQIAGASSSGNDIQADSYGFGLYRRPSDRALFVFERPKEATSALPHPKLEQYAVRGTAEAVTVERVRSLDYRGGTAEGIVVDDELGFVYVSEEQIGVHKYRADPGAPAAPLAAPFARRDGIFGQREGIALYTCPEGQGYLILSSQGNSTFKIYDRATNDYLATFVPVNEAGERLRLNTDGVDATSVPLGDPAVYTFDAGAVVVQDDVEKRFHFYDWRDIAEAAALESCGGGR